jgi:hypothetical protein
MPSIDDVYNELKNINFNLEAVVKELNQANATLTTTLSATQSLVTLADYTSHAVGHITRQDDTIICILEKVSHHTCSLLNESHAQTIAQGEMRLSISTIEDITELAHPAAALETKRGHELRNKLDACCPPALPDPPCKYEPCDAPLPLPDPPHIDQPPPII